MKTIFKFSFFIFAFCNYVISMGQTTDQSMSCGDTAILFQILNGNQLATYDPNTQSFYNVGNVNNIKINAIGFNKNDGYLYGLKIGTNILVKIGKDGIFHEQGSVSGLPNGINFNSGDMDDLGHLYVYKYKILYTIDIETNSCTRQATDLNITTSDMTFFKKERCFYTVADNSDFIKFDSSGFMVKLGKINTSCNAFGSSYTDNQGYYYVFCNQSGKIYKIDLENPLVPIAVLNSDRSISSNDGASCTDAEIEFPVKCEINLAIENEIPCAGESEGSLKVDLLDVTATSFDYLWSTGDTTSTLNNLNVGEYSVILTGSDGCMAYDTIVLSHTPDTTAPTAISQNIIVYLNNTGNTTITPNDVDNGSFDNCKIKNMAISFTNFDCTTKGTNIVTLTVEDYFGNASSSQSIVTVIDTNNNCGTIACKDTSVLFQTVNGNQLVTYDPITNTYDNSRPKNTFLINAIGFNKEDGYLYGLDDYASLVRIGDDGIFEKLGKPAGLPTTRFLSGDLDDKGNLVVYKDRALYTIDIEARTTTSVLTSSNVRIADLTFVKSKRLFYSLTHQKDLISIDSTGKVTDLGKMNVSCNGGFGASYTDANEDLYFFCNASGVIFKTNLDDPLNPIAHLNTGRILSVNDGASCADGEIEFPVNCEINLAIQNPIPCTGESEGALKVNLLDVTATSFDYLWSTGETTSTLNNLNVGEYSVILTGSDGCMAYDTIVLTHTPDTTAPTALCQNTTISLDDKGEASIEITDIDKNSTDDCEISNLSLSTTAFDCSNLGDNEVVLTVTDYNGNESTCTSIVTVDDDLQYCNNCFRGEITPSLSCDDCTITVPSNGWAQIGSNEIACLTEKNNGGINFSNNATLIVCGNVELQGLNLANGTTVIIHGTLTVQHLNFNASNSILENYGKLFVKNGLNLRGTLSNYGTITVGQQVNINNDGELINNGEINVKNDMNANDNIVNSGALEVEGNFHVNSNADFLNNCSLTVGRNFFINSNTHFINDGEVFVDRDMTLNSTSIELRERSTIETENANMNNSLISNTETDVAMINVSKRTMFNQPTFDGNIKYCDENGVEINNNPQFRNGAFLACTEGSENNEDEVSLVISPNPIQKGGVLTSNYSSNNYRVRIINQMNEIVFEQYYNNSNNQINLSNIKEGLYTVHVIENNGDLTAQKLIVTQ